MNKVRKICFISILVSILVVSKEVLAFLPNIEVVTLLLIICATTLDLKDSIMITIVYSTIECLLYGFNLYGISYYVAWLFIVIISYIFLRNANVYKVAFFSLFYGIIFDAFFSLPFFVVSFKTGLAYLMNGAIFSLVHGISNFVIVLCLYEVVDRNFKTLLRKNQISVK